MTVRKESRLKPAIRLLAITVIALVAMLGLHPATVDAASSPTVTKTASAKPTVVLVHGAWADGSSWAKETTRLQNQGYDVLVPPNPLRSLTGDAAYIADFLSTITGPIVLVAHSYGGAVISQAATGNPNVVALVYVDAFVPDEGEFPVTLAGADSAVAAPPETVFDFRPYPGAPTGDADLYLKKEIFLNAFAPDVTTKKALAMYASQKPIAGNAFTEATGPVAWRDIPSWYLLGKQDQIITPEAQRFMAERAESHIKAINASHVSLVSRPAAVTALIVQAIKKTS